MEVQPVKHAVVVTALITTHILYAILCKNFSSVHSNLYRKKQQTSDLHYSLSERDFPLKLFLLSLHALLWHYCWNHYHSPYPKQ